MFLTYNDDIYSLHLIPARAFLCGAPHYSPLYDSRVHATMLDGTREERRPAFEYTVQVAYQFIYNSSNSLQQKSLLMALDSAVW